jgi:hypothetical protein
MHIRRVKQDRRYLSVAWLCWSDQDRISHRFSSRGLPSVWLMAGRSVPAHYTTLREANGRVLGLLARPCVTVRRHQRARCPFRFLNGDVRHGRGWRGAVPTFLSRLEPDHVTWSNVLDGTTPVLYPTAASRHDQGLAKPSGCAILHHF